MSASNRAALLRRRYTMRQLRTRLHYLWFDAPTDWVELLSAMLSAAFGLLLIYRGPNANALAYAYAYAALCYASSSCKVFGVLFEWRKVRIVGLWLGTIFWVTLSFVLLIGTPGSISWLCFAVLAAVQMWAAWRISRT